jgi:hypothetical protein
MKLHCEMGIDKAAVQAPHLSFSIELGAANEGQDRC